MNVSPDSVVAARNIRAGNRAEAVTGPVVQAGAIYGGVHIQAGRSVPVSRQLPPAPPRFTNRFDELSILDQIVCKQEDRIGLPGLALLTGPGGVGKSALAVSWAVRMADKFPDGQFYADLRGFSAESPVLPEEVLARFLRALGVAPELVPLNLAEQTTTFRTLTARKRMLFLIDNALSAKQVRPLLPASTESMVVVTSRLRLSELHNFGAEYVHLTPLSEQHAIELMSKTLGKQRFSAEKAQVVELVSLCGRLPIALCVAGARLATHPQWKVSKVVADLTNEQNRLARLSHNDDVSVTSTFDLSYQALSIEQAQLYRLISAHPGPEFSLGVASAAARLAETDAENAIQALVDASLLEEIAPNRYRFHDLVRLHSRALAKQAGDDLDEAQRRIAEWFLHQVTRANMVVIPIRWRISPVDQQYRDTPALFASGGEAVDWLDAQLPNLLALLADLVKCGLDDLAWQICESLWELFLHRKHYRDWIASHQLGIKAAERCANTMAESRLRCQLGRAYLDLHRFEDAKIESAKARDLAKQAESKHNESVALQQLGHVERGQGRIEKAIYYYEQSLLLEQELGIDRGIALRHQRIGEALLAAGRKAEAAERLEQSRAIFVALSSLKDEAKVLIPLALIDTQAGHINLAKSRLMQALDVLSESGSSIDHADVLIALAEVEQSSGNYPAAHAHLIKALELCESIGGPYIDRIQTFLATLNSNAASDLT